MNSEEFKIKFLPFHKKMYRIAFRLLENSEEAQDVVQEVYVKLWEKRNEMNSVNNAESFCVVMIKNLCMDVLRSARNRSVPFENVYIDNNESHSLLNDFENKEALQVVEEIIKKLPEQQQLIFRLRHNDDCSLEEIEKITGLSSVNVRVILSRIRKTIKEQFHLVYNNETSLY